MEPFLWMYVDFVYIHQVAITEEMGGNHDVWLLPSFWYKLFNLMIYFFGLCHHVGLSNSQKKLKSEKILYILKFANCKQIWWWNWINIIALIIFYTTLNLAKLPLIIVKSWDFPPCILVICWSCYKEIGCQKI